MSFPTQDFIFLVSKKKKETEITLSKAVNDHKPHLNIHIIHIQGQ